MNRTRAKLAAALLLAAPAVVLMAGAPRPLTDLRVCADPFDLAFSNDQEQGFENKIAHVVAQDLNARVVNYWWPSRRGVRRNSILGGFCDVMIQAPVGLDPVATTKPYYRSTYYFVFRADRGLRLRSLDDTILKHLKIGVNIIGYDYTNTPPAHALGSRGIVGLVGFGNFLNPDPKADHPDDIIRAVAKDSIDVAIVWGPLAGYWVKRAPVALTMVALPDSDPVSDLRWVLSTSGMAYPRDSFEYTALNGRPDKGMPAWKVLLDTAAVKQLYQYVKARSDGWLKPGRPHRESDLKKSQ